MTMPRRAAPCPYRLMCCCTVARLAGAVLVLVVLVPLASAQPARTAPEPLPRYRFERLTVTEGLPENYVQSLLQSRSGLLWIGTQNGLVRYDGRSVHVTKQRSPSGRVQIGHVKSLTEDARGDLWAGGDHNSGLWHLDRRTERWTSYEHDAGNPATLSGNAIGAIEEAAPGRIIAMTGPGGGLTYCLDRLDVATGAVRRFRMRGASASAPEGECLSLLPEFFPERPERPSLKDRRGLVWIGTTTGLLRYDAHADSVTYFRPPSMVRYGGARFRALDDALRSARPLASIEQPGDSVDLGVPFRLERATRVLLVGAGEMAMRRRADYGWLEDARGRVVWMMRHDSSAWTGAFGSNRLSVATRVLPAGAYRLRFRSDFDRSPADDFKGRKPERPDLWGVRVVALAQGGASAASRLVTGAPPPRRPDEVPVDMPAPLAEDADGVWLGGRLGGGLIRWEARTGHFRTIHATPDVPGDTLLEWTDIRALLPGVGGMLWVGTDQGLFRVRGALGPRPTSTRFTFDPAAGEPLNIVSEIVAGEGGTLWLATFGGLVHFDPATGRRQIYPTNTNRPDGLSGEGISRLLRDRQQNLWIGTSWGGLHRLDRTAARATRLRYDANDAAPFPGVATGSVAQIPGGATWATTDSGLVRMTGSPRTATQVISNGLSFSYATLLVDRAGRLWQAGLVKGMTSGSVFRLDPQTGRVLERFPRSGEAPLPYGVRIYALAVGPGGTLWVGTFGAGLMRLDPVSGRFQGYPFRRTPRAGVSDSLDYPEVLSITTDRSGAVWIGTNDGGINRLDVATGRFTSYYDKGRGAWVVTPIHEDRRGRLWFGTYQNGLFLLDRRTGALTNYGPDEGLAHYEVNGIQEDAAGMLWLNTPAGISRFDPDTRRFRTFGPQDGMPSIGATTNASFRTRDGQILFGGQEGLLVFDPRAFSEAAPRPLLSLGALTYRTGAGRDSTRALVALRRVDLPFDASEVTITFTGHDYVQPDAVRYQYRLNDGPQAVTWTDGGKQGIVRYPALPSGDYRFEVRAAGADGVWTAPESVRVVVQPPWWRTWWAYLAYGLLFGATVFVVDRVQRRRVVARERARAERATAEAEREQARVLGEAYTQLDVSHRQLKGAQAQLVQQEKLASLGALTAGIAHEIKNPLNFVNNFASLSAELVREIKAERADKPGLLVSDVEDVLDDLEGNVTRIEEHGRRADAIVKGMLMHARGGSGQREMVDVNALVDEAANLAYHGMRAQRPGIDVTLTRDLDASVGSVDGVPQDLSRVVLNLVNNALYAVADRSARPAGGGDGAVPSEGFPPSVRVSTHGALGAVEIRVWDNGGGIPESVRQRIFEPFFTTKPAGEGTGLGLSLSNDIVAAHGGRLTLESDETAGTTEFTIRLPHKSSIVDSEAA